MMQKTRRDFSRSTTSVSNDRGRPVAWHSGGCACKPCYAWRAHQRELHNLLAPILHISVCTINSCLSPPGDPEMRKVPASMYWDPATFQELRVIAQASGHPVSRLVREAVDQWLERRRKGRRTTVKPLPTNRSK